MKKTLKKLLPLLILFISVSMAYGQSRAQGLQDLIGAKGSSAESELQNRGYVHIKTAKSNYDIYSYWWNYTNKKCVSYHMADGRVLSIVNSMPYDCNKSSSNNGNNNGYNSYSHQAHHHADNNYSHYNDNNQENAYERGFNDGLHNKSYHNIYNDSNQKSSYSKGYGSGIGQRNNNTSYHSGSGGYQSHVQVSDLDNWLASSAYDEMRSRGFREEGEFVGSGDKHRLFKVWYNTKTKQCVKTAEKNGKITMIQKSDKCNH